MRWALKGLLKFAEASLRPAFIFTVHVYQSVINDQSGAISQQRQPVAMLTVSAINRAKELNEHPMTGSMRQLMIINIPRSKTKALYQKKIIIYANCRKGSANIHENGEKFVVLLPVNSRKCHKSYRCLHIREATRKGATKVQLGAVQIFSLKCEKHSTVRGRMKLWDFAWLLAIWCPFGTIRKLKPLPVTCWRCKAPIQLALRQQRECKCGRRRAWLVFGFMSIDN